MENINYRALTNELLSAAIVKLTGFGYQSTLTSISRSHIFPAPDSSLMTIIVMAPCSSGKSIFHDGELVSASVMKLACQCCTYINRVMRLSLTPVLPCIVQLRCGHRCNGRSDLRCPRTKALIRHEARLPA